MRPQDLHSALHILIVDDHAIVREGLKHILESPAAAWTVAEAENGLRALELLRNGNFDLAVVDLSMPGMSGLELLRRIRQEFARLPVLILSTHSEEQYAMRAFRAGAKGYVTKDLAAHELDLAVRKVADGGTYVSPSLAERMVLQLNGSFEAPRHDQLSDRELDVTRRLVAGQRPTDIANELHLSIKTVSTHKSRILERLQLPNLAALIRYGMEHGLGNETDGGDGLSAAD
jgi:DNA-binding NarL/FixJ family response regulator